MKGNNKISIIIPPLPPSPHLEIVRQFLPSSIARVHGDENGTGCIEGDLRTLKDEALEPPGSLPPGCSESAAQSQTTPAQRATIPDSKRQSLVIN